MAWVANSGAGGWVWDAGPYLPGSSVSPRAPHHTLFAGIDCGEIDYVVIDSSHSPSSFSYSQARHDVFTYTYDAGGVMAFEFFPVGEDPSITPTTPHLYVVFYNEAFDAPGSYVPAVANGMDLVPSAYCTGGLAANPVPPANDDFANAITLPSTTSGSFDLPANAEWASTEIAEYVPGVQNQVPFAGCTTWWKFIPPTSGDQTFTIPMVGSTSNPAAWIDAYRDSSHPGSHPAAYSPDWSSSFLPHGAIHITGAVAGETIWLQVDTGDSYAAHITWQGPPPNDPFASRTVVPAVTASVDVAFDLRGSTLQSGEQHTTGMAGSAWHEVTVPIDKYVYFELPSGVEARLYRGTATLAGMTYQDVSSDTARRAFSLDSSYTYFLKLQSATATESGVMHVRPFAWTDFRTPDPVQERGGEKFTRLNGSNTDGLSEEAPFSTAWANAVAGTVVTSNQVSGAGLGPTHPLGWSISTSDTINFFADLGLGILSIEWGGTVGPLYAANWPTDPSGLDPALIDGLDFATDPVTSDAIEWDSGTAALVDAAGTVAFTAAADSGTDGGDARTLAFYVNPISPPAVYTDIPAWPTLPGSGDDPLTLSYTPPGTRSVTGGSSAAAYDLYSHLSGTHGALLVSPSPAEPALGTVDDGPAGAVADMRINNVILTATLPVQYPRYKMYAPLPAATFPPLRQFHRDDGLAGGARSQMRVSSRQVSNRAAMRGSYI